MWVLALTRGKGTAVSTDPFAPPVRFEEETLVDDERNSFMATSN